MKQTVLKQPPERVRRQVRRRTALCLLAAVLTLTLNLVLVLTVSERTNVLFCRVNIVSDVLLGIFVIWFYSEKVAPLKRLCRLACKPMTDCFGTVSSLSGDTVRYMDMDCHTLTVNDRTLFLPAASLELSEGKAYRFRLVSNIIMEAEQ